MSASVIQIPTPLNAESVQQELSEICVLQKQQIYLYEQWRHHCSEIEHLMREATTADRYSLSRELYLHEASNHRVMITMISEEMDGISREVRRRLESCKAPIGAARNQDPFKLFNIHIPRSK